MFFRWFESLYSYKKTFPLMANTHTHTITVQIQGTFSLYVSDREWSKNRVAKFKKKMFKEKRKIIHAHTSLYICRKGELPVLSDRIPARNTSSHMVQIERV